MELEFTVDVSAADFFAANAKHFRMGWAAQKLTFAYLSSAFLLTVVAMAAVGPSDAGFLDDLRAQLPLGAGIAAVLLVTRYAVCWLQLPGTSNQLHAQTGTMEMPTTYHLTPDRFKASYAEGTSDHPWCRFIDYLETDTVLMLRRTPGFMFLFPKRCLTAEQLDQFRALLTAVGVKRS